MHRPFRLAPWFQSSSLRLVHDVQHRVLGVRLPDAHRQTVVRVRAERGQEQRNRFAHLAVVEQILENVFGYDSESNDSTIITHIKNIRNKLQEFDYAPIKTVWGVGYKWEE